LPPIANADQIVGRIDDSPQKTPLSTSLSVKRWIIMVFQPVRAEALNYCPHPDWNTVHRSTDLTRLDIDFREMGELSAFVHMPTLPDPKNV